MAGSVVSLGNHWRFPYLVGENGGAAFMLIADDDEREHANREKALNLAKQCRVAVF